MSGNGSGAGPWLIAACRPGGGVPKPPPGPLPANLFEVASLQGVVGPVAAALESWGRLREDAARGFREAAAMIEARARAQELLLADIVETMESAGIPFLVLKGLPLDLATAGSSRHRWHKDVDLLVPAAERERARRALETVGFRLVRRQLAGGSQDLLAPEGWRGVGTLELHVDVTPAYHPVRFTVADWFGSAERVSFSWGEVPVPPWPATVAYLAWHAFARGRAVLRDVAVLARGWVRLDDDERDRARATAEAAGALRFLDEGLFLAASTWPGLVPARGSRGRGALLSALSRPACLLDEPRPSWQRDLLVHWLLLPGGRRGLELGRMLVRTILAHPRRAPRTRPGRVLAISKAALSVGFVALAALARRGDGNGCP